MKRGTMWKAGAAALALGILAVWAAGEAMISRTNPGKRYAGIILTPEADAVLKRACFDCHSNETRYPAYSYLPFASLLLANHVNEGREAGNFSDWGEMSQEDRTDSIEESLEEIEKGRMPIPNYLWMHPEARLSAADRALLQDAALKVYGVTPEQEGKRRPEKGGKRKERD